MFNCTPILRNVIVLAASFQVATLDAADWSQFLGPQRNGISTETELLEVWPKDGLPEVWRTAGGAGMSGLAIRQDQLLTMNQDDNGQHVLCLNSQTGKPIWKKKVAPIYRNSQGHGPRATPTIQNGSVFVFTGQGILAKLNLADGKIIWSHNAVADCGGEPAEYGMASSPLVVDQNVIVTVGAPKATVVAYNSETGKIAWKAGQTDTTGYSSPALLNLAGRQQIVTYSGSSVIGIAPQDGTLLWRHPYKTDYNCNTATPIAIDGNVFVSSGENHGSVLLKLIPNGKLFQVTEVWASQGVKSVLRNEWQTSVLIAGHLYGYDNVGSAGQISHLTCINATTGAPVWRELRFGKGNLIAADGKLFMSSMKGELIVAKASPKAYTEIGRSKVIETTRQAPALANGLLFLRDETDIVCLDVRKNPK